MKNVFTVDRARWRVGDNGETKHGEGPTMLLNSEGYQCCLGFACQQLYGAEADALIGCALPQELEIRNRERMPALTDMVASSLASMATMLNDDSRIGRAQRERELIRLFAEHGITLTFDGKYEDEA